MMSAAAAACLCDHHLPVASTAELSCHTEAHSEGRQSDADELAAVSGDAVEAVCDCFTYSGLPSVPAGQAAKKAIELNADEATFEVWGRLVPSFYAVTPSLDIVSPDEHLFSIPRISAPSRAPPSL